MTHEIIHYTDDGQEWRIVWPDGHTIDAMQAVQRWAEDECLSFAWADANLVLEVVWQIHERRELSRRMDLGR